MKPETKKLIGTVALTAVAFCLGTLAADALTVHVVKRFNLW